MNDYVVALHFTTETNSGWNGGNRREYLDYPWKRGPAVKWRARKLWWLVRRVALISGLSKWPRSGSSWVIRGFEHKVSQRVSTGSSFTPLRPVLGWWQHAGNTWNVRETQSESMADSAVTGLLFKSSLNVVLQPQNTWKAHLKSLQSRGVNTGT